MRPRGAIGRLDAKRTIMANTPSAKKATRKIEARTAVNKARRSRVRTFIRKVEEAITAGDHKQAMEALAVAAPEIARASSKGIVHANLAARKVSRLNHRVKALSA
eukprot:GHVR01040634.1.p2 GENE.GHVR01040634.1~~GHVR01040634.1.p2  ORF type:complete len:105 (+),score=11.34 GHVR01040634.1:1-315(+)